MRRMPRFSNKEAPERSPVSDLGSPAFGPTDDTPLGLNAGSAVDTNRNQTGYSSVGAPDLAPPPMTVAQLKGLRFTVSEPQGYFFGQVESFVDQVGQALQHYEDADFQWRQAMYEMQVELDQQTYDLQRVRQEIELFKVQGSPVMNPDGSFVTESQRATEAEVARLNEILAQMYATVAEKDAEIARLTQAVTLRNDEVQALHLEAEQARALLEATVAPADSTETDTVFDGLPGTSMDAPAADPVTASTVSVAIVPDVTSDMIPTELMAVEPLVEPALVQLAPAEQVVVAPAVAAPAGVAPAGVAPVEPLTVTEETRNSPVPDTDSFFPDSDTAPMVDGVSVAGSDRMPDLAEFVETFDEGQPVPVLVLDGTLTVDAVDAPVEETLTVSDFANSYDEYRDDEFDEDDEGVDDEAADLAALAAEDSLPEEPDGTDGDTLDHSNQATPPPFEPDALVYDASEPQGAHGLAVAVALGPDAVDPSVEGFDVEAGTEVAIVAVDTVAPETETAEAVVVETVADETVVTGTVTDTSAANEENRSGILFDEEDDYDTGWETVDEGDEESLFRQGVVFPFDTELPEGVTAPGTMVPQFQYPDAAPGAPLNTNGVPLEVWAPEVGFAPRGEPSQHRKNRRKKQASE